MIPEAAYTIVCPGCGWTGKEDELAPTMGMSPLCCPDCRYENGFPPHRLLTVKEMVEFPVGEGYNQVNMYEFLQAIIPFLLDEKDENK